MAALVAVGTARNSRLGFKLGAPDWGSVKASAVVEFDFFGGAPLTTTQGESYTAGPMRMRHFYAKLETPIVDVLAGQYHDLFAWAGAGSFGSKNLRSVVLTRCATADCSGP